MQKQNKKIWKILTSGCCLLLLLSFAVSAFSSNRVRVAAFEMRDTAYVNMYLGEIRVFPIAGIDRVAVGNPKVLSNSILSQGQLVVLANSVGVTTLYIWLDNGKERRIDVRVIEKEKIDSYTEIVQLVKSIKGVRVKKVGELTVVEGAVAAADKAVFDRIMERYKDVLNLVRPADSYREVTALLADIPHIKINRLGNNTVVTGEVDEENAKLIQLVESRYPNFINMSKKEAVVASKMVYMDVKIMEVAKSFTESIGINWADAFRGPSFGFGSEVTRNGGTILNSSSISSVFASSGNANLSVGAGYFGIAADITSKINLSEQSGDAVTLAQPRLSARSGGKAEFLAGGEYPMPTTSTEGQVNVEFKPYGIILKIEPVVDDNNNIIAHVETEVSEVDDDTAVGTIKGIKSRSTKTDISMLEGQTLVISGLLKEVGGISNDDVAWLRDLPVLGPLFQSSNFRNNKTELVIFVTPTIHDVNSPENKAALEKAKKIRTEYAKIVEGTKILD